MTAAAGASTSGATTREPILTPVDRVSGVIFGLIMALTFTGSLSVATADRSEVREMLIGALGCNIAWGLVDAVMYLMAIMAERGREFILLRELHTTPDRARARELILAPLPRIVAQTMEPDDVERVRARLAGLPEPARQGLNFQDLRAAFMVFLLVFLSTLPIALPFAFIAEPHRALRVSNGIALGMLFLGGYLLARHSGHRPWVGGILTLGVGVVLVWATIALGG